MNYRKLIKIATILTFVGFNISCSTKYGLVNRKDGSYNLNIINSTKDTEPIVIGVIYEYTTKEILPGAFVKADKSPRIMNDKAGKYVFNISPGKHSFEGFCVGYKSTYTKPILIKKGHTVKIDFYLKQYNTKLVESPIRK
ncbi:hypothetical protein HDE69_000592 [Pedobacter cryoconitis]|uniref:Uncharacterized protein n=2 Tax=Pedobacter cryoconitis TaxID=188932 RepID=A0A7W8YPP9_9SPHI|nr:hypothetical protein [Pedobacter cryoconitis]